MEFPMQLYDKAKRTLSNKAWRHANKERERQNKIRWRAENKERVKRYARNSLLKAKYGITLEQYEQLAAEQKNLCYICQQPSTKSVLCVDHCHKTKRVRRLLCRPCNLVIGNANENIAVLERAIDYLREH